MIGIRCNFAAPTAVARRDSNLCHRLLEVHMACPFRLQHHSIPKLDLGNVVRVPLTPFEACPTSPTRWGSPEEQVES